MERVLATCLFPVVADAASAPLHWIYKEEALNEVLGVEGPDAPLPREVAFWSPPSGPFYRVPVGRNSCYGDQAVHLLQFVQGDATLAETRGAPVAFSREAYSRSAEVFFGPGSEYDATATAEYHVDGTTTGKLRRQDVKADWPIPRPWLHFSLRKLLDNAGVSSESGAGGAAGAGGGGSDVERAARAEPGVGERPAWPWGASGDEQMDGVAKVGPAVAVWVWRRGEAGAREDNEGLVQFVVDAVRSTQDDPLAIGCAAMQALIVKHLLTEESTTVRDSVERSLRVGALLASPIDERVFAAVHDAIDTVDGRKEIVSKPEGTPAFTRSLNEHVRAVGSFDKTCHLPGGFSSALHAALWGEREALAAFDVLQTTIRAGGCNCSRAAAIAAIFAARDGLRAIPSSWTDKAFQFHPLWRKLTGKPWPEVA
jgi:hypothetical protein